MSDWNIIVPCKTCGDRGGIVCLSGDADSMTMKEVEVDGVSADFVYHHSAEMVECYCAYHWKNATYSGKPYTLFKVNLLGDRVAIVYLTENAVKLRDHIYTSYKKAKAVQTEAGKVTKR